MTLVRNLVTATAVVTATVAVTGAVTETGAVAVMEMATRAVMAMAIRAVMAMAIRAVITDPVETMTVRGRTPTQWPLPGMSRVAGDPDTNLQKTRDRLSNDVV